MRDVFSQKIFRVRKESLRHATAVLKTVSGEFLNQFAEMIDDRGIFRAKEPDFPLMPQAETQHQFVHPLGFSCTGNSGDVDTSPTFIRADLIHLLPSRFRSGTEAVVEKSNEGLKDYSIVAGSFGVKANAEGLKDWLDGQGYHSTIAFNADKAMYRVIVNSFADKTAAAEARDAFKAKYPNRSDFQGAWLLYRVY